jgi:hypothetical protein
MRVTAKNAGIAEIMLKKVWACGFYDAAFSINKCN